MYPRTPWEMAAYALESAEHTLGTAVVTQTAHHTADAPHAFTSILR